jgi:hypothetical protein
MGSTDFHLFDEFSRYESSRILPVVGIAKSFTHLYTATSELFLTVGGWSFCQVRQQQAQSLHCDYPF